MATLNSYFDELLSNIEPDPKAKEYAQYAHNPIREHLEKDEEFQRYFENSFLYGSYRRYTAVGDLKDVDIVVLTSFTRGDEPKTVLRKLKKALNNYYQDSDGLAYQRRSIRVDYPLGDEAKTTLTLDVIPAIALNGEDNPLIVPDRELGYWIESHPKGHIKHSSVLNSEDVSKGKYVPLVKMMKWWWKYQCQIKQPDVERPKPKGFWIECLTGENFDPKAETWADHFITTLKNVRDKYQYSNQVPELRDPGLESQTVKTSMTFEDFKFFRETLNESLKTAEKAYAEQDLVTSSEFWREIFGDKFPLSEADDAIEEKALVAADTLPLGDYSHITPPPWPICKRYSVRIDAYLYSYDKRKRLSGLNSNRRTIPNGLQIKYVAKVNVPKPYEVFWQVVNTGDYARRVNGLRGKIFPGTETQWEHSEYTGKHWIECFIVKNGVCVARNRFYVSIRNRNS